MAESEIDFALPDAAATDVLGAALGAGLPSGAHGGYVVLYLHGDLGRGQDHLCAQSSARAVV